MRQPRKSNNSSLQVLQRNSRGTANQPHRDLRGKVDSSCRVWDGEPKELDVVDLNHKELDVVDLNHKELEEVDLNHKELDVVDLNHKEVDEVDLNHKEVDEVDLNHKELDVVDLKHKELDGEDLNHKELVEVSHSREWEGGDCHKEQVGMDLLSRVLGRLDLNNKAQEDPGLIQQVHLDQGFLQQSLRGKMVLG